MPRFIEALGHDLRYAARALRHSPSFTVWVVGSLAIGMAVTVAALALLNGAVFAPFPGVTAQERLARVSVSRNCGRPDCWTRMASLADYRTLREGLHGAQGLAAYMFTDVSAGLPEARSLRGVIVSANYFDVLGVRPALGRHFGERDGEADAQVAVIAHAAWAREFGSDPSAVGRTIRVGGRFVEIVGVAPPFFAGIDRTRPGAPRSMTVEPGPDIWLPLAVSGLATPAPQRTEELSFVARLAEGMSVERLRAEASVVASRLAAWSGPPGTGRADVQEVRRVNPRTWRFAVVILLPIPVLVLCIACINAANLMLARGSQREHEVAIRLAIGASRGRIVGQLLAESAVLAALATSIGLLLAWWALRLVSNPLGMPLPFDPTVLALTLLTASVTTVAFGLAPALRVSGQRPSSALGPGARTGLPGQSRSRRALVAAQVAVSLALLATGSQLVSTVRGEAVSAATASDRVLIARFDLEPLAFTTAAAEAFYQDVTAAAARLPGVEAVGLARHSAVWSFGRGSTSSSLRVWRPQDGPAEGHTVSGGYAGGDLFGVVGLRVLAGRGFTEADRQGRPRVALINDSAASTLAGPAVGSILRIAPQGEDVRSSYEVAIVGVIESTREPRLDQQSRPAARVYLPVPIEAEPALSVYVRSSGAARSVAQPLREAVRAIAPDVPVVEIGSLEELNERSYSVQLWLARAAAVIGAIGLLLATAGLYGVASHVAAVRSREMAIRIAVGAPPRLLLVMMIGQSMRLALTGLLAGGAAALVASRMIQAEYHGVRAIDASAFAGAVSLFLAAMLVASAGPAIRASRIDPIAALKES